MITRAPKLLRFRWIAIVLLVLGQGKTAQSNDWVLPDSRLGVRTAPVLLLTRPDVQAELRLTKDQNAAVQRIVSDLWSRAAGLRGKSDKEALAGRRAIDEDQRSQLEALLDEKQRARLLELDLQWEGPLCLLSRSWVTSWVGVSPEERQGLASLVDARLSEARNLPAAGVAVARSAAGESLLNALSAEQRTRWNELTGKTFHFQKVDAEVGKASVTLPERRGK